jgi:hypothetical protein
MFQLGTYRKMNDSMIRSFREAIHAPVGKVKKIKINIYKWLWSVNKIRLTISAFEQAIW